MGVNCIHKMFKFAVNHALDKTVVGHVHSMLYATFDVFSSSRDIQCCHHLGNHQHLKNRSQLGVAGK